MEYITIARVVNTYGIKGELKVVSETDFPDLRFQAGTPIYFLESGKKVKGQATIADYRQHKGTYLIRLREYDNINQVETFKGTLMAIAAEDQHELEEGVYYHHQIIGLEVITTDGEPLGKIKEILSLGSNDVWVVKREQKKDLLLPIIKDVVKSVDVQAGRVVVRIPEGLETDED